jgi:hypothetical protein
MGMLAERRTDAVERMIQLLEKGALPFSLREIAEAIRRHGLEVEGDLEAFADEVKKEWTKRTAGVLEGLWQVLEVPPPPEVWEALLEGSRVEVHYPWPAGGHGGGRGVLVWAGDEDRTLHFRLPHRVRSEAFSLTVGAWQLRVKAGPGLFARREGASLLADSPWEVEWALEETRALRPLFAALGLADLEGALEALLGLEDGEARQEGPYVLAREGETRVLRRGALFQDPALDGAFLLGREVEISFPEGVKMFLEGRMAPQGWIGLRAGNLQWGKDLVRLARPAGYADDPRVLSRLILHGVRSRTKSHDFLYSPRTRALLEELENLDEERNVLEALKDKGFFARVYTRTLAAL